MLIRNATSRQDLESKKKLQAEILQLRIENEALLEQRVANFQNPNKPPPIPPQYKTTAELQQDSLYQQKLAIENLRELKVDFAVATQVTQNLLQEPEGIGNLVKLNANFPAIKEAATKKLTPAAINSVDGIMEIIDKSFSDIDNNLGFLSGTNSTSFFSSVPKIAFDKLIGEQTYGEIKRNLEALSRFYAVPPTELGAIIGKIDEIIAVSPSLSQLDFIDSLDKTQRTQILSQISALETKLPAKLKIARVTDILAKAVYLIFSGLPITDNSIDNSSIATNKDEYFEALSLLKSAFSKFDRKTAEKLDQVKNSIASKQSESISTKANIIGVTPVVAGQLTRADIIRQNLRTIEEKFNPAGLQSTELMNRLSSKTGMLWDDNQGNAQRSDLYATDVYFNQVPTTDGREAQADGGNVIFEYATIYQVDVGATNPQGIIISTDLRQVGRAKTKLKCPVDILGNLVTISRDRLEKYLKVAVSPRAVRRFKYHPSGQNPIAILQVTPQNNPNGGQPALVFDTVAYDPTLVEPRYKRAELVRMIRDIELPYLQQRLQEDDNFDPIHIRTQQIVPEQGFGIKKGFMAKKIKVGKGIAIQEKIPRYREFGKYIIHYPHLIDESVLNLKFPSTGSIPSIKPVKVDENYKQFIIDVLDSNKVNKKHYESLSQPEKNHFSLIVRGAKLEKLLKFTPESTDDEDYKRLELCIGEINAGNDNQHIKDEIKSLLKKFVNNGRVSKLKATDILLQL